MFPVDLCQWGIHISGTANIFTDFFCKYFIPLHATGLLNKIKRSDKNSSIPKPILCVASFVIAIIVAVLIKVLF